MMFSFLGNWRVAMDRSAIQLTTSRIVVRNPLMNLAGNWFA